MGFTSKTSLTIALVLIGASLVQAEFVCRSDVKYRWRKDEKTELTVFWAVLEKRAATEDEAKSGLAEAANRERARALDTCQREHQNTSGCIASRLDSSQAILAQLSFSARNKLEESVVADCNLKQGECIAVDVSEAQCRDLNPAPPEEEGKDAGKKGKAK